MHNSLGKRHRKLIEADLIISYKSINHQEGFFRLARAAGTRIMIDAKGAVLSTSNQSARKDGLESQSGVGGSWTTYGADVEIVCEFSAILFEEALVVKCYYKIYSSLISYTFHHSKLPLWGLAEAG